MFFKRRHRGMRGFFGAGLALLLALLLGAAALAVFSQRTAGGSLRFLEDGDKTGFSWTFKGCTRTAGHELALSAGDVLRVGVERQGGTVSFALRGKNGSVPYSGRDLDSCGFTVTVSETDGYSFTVDLRGATGSLRVSRLSSPAAPSAPGGPAKGF